MEKEVKMSRNGAGTYVLPAGQPVVTGTTISSTVHNTLASDIANALTTSIATDGQSVVSANIPFSGYKLTGIGAATVAGDAIRYEQFGSLADTQITTLSALTSINILPGYLYGCTMSTAGSSATMSIAAGRATDSTGLQSMALSAIAKTTSAWAVGTASGGLDTGAIANSTWYHFYVIRRPDTGVVDVVFSTNATTPTLPANYTQYRYIGSGLTNGSAQWTSFSQNGDEFLWLSAVLDANGVTPNSSAAQLLTISVPPGVKVNALLNATIGGGGTVNNQMLISSPDVNNAGASLTGAPLWSGPTAYNIGNGSFATPANVRTNTSAQIRYRLITANVATSVYIATLGYINRRGRD